MYYCPLGHIFILLELFVSMKSLAYLISPSQSASVHTLLANCDKALYDAKKHICILANKKQNQRFCCQNNYNSITCIKWTLIIRELNPSVITRIRGLTKKQYKMEYLYTYILHYPFKISNNKFILRIFTH